MWRIFYKTLSRSADPLNDFVGSLVNVRGSQSIEEAASYKIWHTAFTFLIGVLLVLIQVKYNGSVSLFEEHPITTTAFILTIFIYKIGYVLMSRKHTPRRTYLFPYQVHHHRVRGHFQRVSSETGRPYGCLYRR